MEFTLSICIEGFEMQISYLVVIPSGSDESFSRICGEPLPNELHFQEQIGLL